MKLYDFECETCGSRFEQMVDEKMALPCRRAPVCHGTAVRLLGGHPMAMPRKSYLGPSAPVQLRHVADTDTGAIVELAGSKAVVSSLEPGMEVKVAMHGHNEDGSCSDRTVIGKAVVIGPPPGEDA